MKCPDCGTPYNCPCDACLKNRPDDLPKWKRVNVKDGDDWDEECPVCYKTESVHWWYDEQFRQHPMMPMKKER